MLFFPFTYRLFICTVVNILLLENVNSQIFIAYSR